MRNRWALALVGLTSATALFASTVVGSEPAPSVSFLKLRFFASADKDPQAADQKTGPIRPSSATSYVHIDEWSHEGNAPARLDLALVATSDSVLRHVIDDIDHIRVGISVKVGQMAADSSTGLTDYELLGRSAAWWPAELAKDIKRSELEQRDRLLLLQRDFDFEKLSDSLWQTGLWPYEVEGRAVVFWKSESRRLPTPLEVHLRAVPGD